MAARIKAKRVFLYCFIPVTFACIWGLTFSVKTYYVCSVALAPEEVRAAEGNRVLTLNRPENYDLGIVQTSTNVSPEHMNQITASTSFLCKVLETPVMTSDSSFTGTFYEYLTTEYRAPIHEIILRWLRGKKHAESVNELPPLDPFYPRGYAAEAVNLARKLIECDVDRRTFLTIIDVKTQDRLVSALIAQSVIDILEKFAAEIPVKKMEVLHNNLQEYIHQTYMSYESALEQGDSAHAAMLLEACASFERQAIVLSGQKQNYKMFSVLKNASVPTEKSGPHHILTALIATILLTLLALLWICRRELLGVSTQ